MERQLLTRLRILLSYNNFYLLLALLTLLRIFLNVKTESIYKGNETKFDCIVENIVLREENNKYELLCKEKVFAYSKEIFEIGDILDIEGVLKEIEAPTNFKLFNYKKHYNKQGIFYRLDIRKSTKKGESLKPRLLVKKYIFNRVKDLDSSSYLSSLILGNKDYIDKDAMDDYKDIGIIHIFSVSGMHIVFLIAILEKIFNKNKMIYIIFILIIYYEIIVSVSILRSIVYFLLKYVNEKLYLRLSKLKIIFLILITLLLINPNYLYSVGFYYSVIISSSIIYYVDKRKSKYLFFEIPILCFIVSVPINLYLYSEINLISIIANIIVVPFFSLVIYPISLLTLIFPFLDQAFSGLINILEYISSLFSSMNLNIVMIKPSLIVIFIYYLFIILFFLNKKIIIYLTILLLIHYNYNFIFPSSYLIMLDVGIGDSFFLYHNNKSILIDTGGNNYEIAKNITIPVLKGYGIRKIDLLILTHGDYDHMGEAINLVKNYKVDKVVLNCGEFNELESELINVLNKNNIRYYSCIDELNIGADKLYFLNTKNYKNENDNSIVIYTEISNYKFLFMGDAGIKREKDILDKYNLYSIDFLKVGHHGSNTSSSKDFINVTKPKYSLISVGKNNRYGHPKDEVLKTLMNSKIYRIDLDGSIEIKLNKNGYKIMTSNA